jgi:ABC transport system ATP-binding/permease protein
VAEGNGRWTEYAGGYSDWLALRPKVAPAPVERTERAERAPARAPRVKLSFKEQRELEILPAAIEALERDQREITERMSRPDYHREGTEQIKQDRLRAAAIEHELAEKFERWSQLEQRSHTAGA